jgi:hypothetical protein
MFGGLLSFSLGEILYSLGDFNMIHLENRFALLVMGYNVFYQFLKYLIKTLF